MPISSHTDYPQNHWKDVLEIISETVSETDFKPQLVSDDPAIGLIHERIVQNIYENEIIICDVSSKNPNVMFELGLRLAFDKPTIIIKDEKTSYSFDTGVVEHIEYPSSLRFNLILKFKENLKNRLIATYEKSIKDSNYSPFLKSFGKTIIPTSINNQEIPESQYIIEKLNNLTEQVKALRYANRYSNQTFYNSIDEQLNNPPKTLINLLVNEYLKSSNNPTRNEMIEFVYSRLKEMNYSNEIDYLIKIFNENDALRKEGIYKTTA